MAGMHCIHRISTLAFVDRSFLSFHEKLSPSCRRSCKCEVLHVGAAVWHTGAAKPRVLGMQARALPEGRHERVLCKLMRA
jgi:hypothetical protein